MAGSTGSRQRNFAERVATCMRVVGLPIDRIEHDRAECGGGGGAARPRRQPSFPKTRRIWTAIKSAVIGLQRYP